MHFQTLAATMLLASAGLCVALPAATNDLHIQPSTGLPASSNDEVNDMAGFTHLLARDPFNPRNDNTCGKLNGGEHCDPKSPGGGKCCSGWGFCGSGKKYCGKECQTGFGHCDGNGHDHGPKKHKEERCGAQHHDHKCSKKQCCSAAGYCGRGRDYCSVPENCQNGFGWCDSEVKPVGPVTNGDHRNLRSRISYESMVVKCKKPKTIAMTYDDGPSVYTHELLDILGKHGAHATFFLGGNNNGKGSIDNNPEWIQILRRMEAEGHQIGSHTWDHPHMNSISTNARREELLKNERAIANVIGKYPTYMRAPYLECDKKCMIDMKVLGYHVVGYEVDSTDYRHVKHLDAMTKVVDVAFDEAPSNGNMLLIQHDTIPVSALDLTKHVLQRAEEKGWKAITVSECLEEPKELDYRHPDHFSAASIAKGGCAIASGVTCLELASFKTKAECRTSADNCFNQIMSPLWQARVNTPDFRKAEKVCDELKHFCDRCHGKNHHKCEKKYFHFEGW